MTIRATLRTIMQTALLLLSLTGCGGGGGGGGGGAGGNFTLSGTISAASGSAVDSDVNDPAAPYADNSTLLTAQDIPNPVTVGGYVNQAGNGAAGRSQGIGDSSDVYRVTLTANQTITLTIADTTAGDLDLFLGDENGVYVDSSEGVGVTESLTVANPGTYLLEVFAFSGASNYTLVIGQQITAARAATLSISDEFVPDQVVAKFRETPATSGRQRGLEIAAAHGLAVKAGTHGSAVLLELDIPARRQPEGREIQPAMLARNPALRARWETLGAIKQLGRHTDVDYAEPNYIRRSTLEPLDQYYSLQWHYPLINLPQAWDITTGDSGVIVAVVDTGILATHPDLQGQLLPGYDFIRDPANANDGNGIDPDPTDPGDQATGGSSFHGTHVAGTIAAATNNATGVSGASWMTRIMPLRALGINGGTSWDIRQAILYAAGLDNDSGTLPAQPADIINLSLGGEGFSQQDQDLFNQVRAQGQIVIAAAGNNSSSVPFYPAS
ncbi:MAG: S8 family serine peptidase, partial [Thiohalobacterales bacterium]|nr:S8 family serine peptidase [Thiohalobacterales bacterium]